MNNIGNCIQETSIHESKAAGFSMACATDIPSMKEGQLFKSGFPDMSPDSDACF